MKVPSVPSNNKSFISNKTVSNCYSITVRTGNGITLGSTAVTQLMSYITKISVYSVMNIEKTGSEAHIQGAIYMESSIRQDNLRRSLLPYVIKMWEENEDLPTDKQREAVKKHGLKVSPHNDFHVLVKYCLKDLYICYVKKEDPYTLLRYDYKVKLFDLLKEVYYDRMPAGTPNENWGKWKKIFSQHYDRNVSEETPL